MEIFQSFLLLTCVRVLAQVLRLIVKHKSNCERDTNDNAEEETVFGVLLVMDSFFYLIVGFMGRATMSKSYNVVHVYKIGMRKCVDADCISNNEIIHHT